jgi:hypothetical protein
VVALAVCHDEKSLPAMGGSDAARCEDSSRNAVAHPFQSRDEGVELSVDVPRDVFAEETRSPAFIKDAEELVDEPTVVAAPLALPGDGIGLAGVARSDAMNRSTPSSAFEGSSVSPDRSRMKPPRFHRRDQRADGSGFPLHVSDSASAGFGNSDGKLESADAGAKSKHVDGI